MTIFKKHLSLTRLVATMLAGTLPSACMHWKPQPLEPARFPNSNETQTVRLTLKSGDTLLVRRPAIVGDSLVGLERQRGARDSLYRVSVPLATIAQAEMKETDPVATVAAVSLGLVAVVAIIRSAVPSSITLGHLQF